MKCWILYNNDDAEKNKWYINEFAENCRNRNIDMKLVIKEKAVFFIKNGSLFLKYEGKTLEPPNFALNRTRDFRLGRLLENADTTVFNNSFVTEICNNKMMTLSYLAKYGVNVCDTALNGNISDEPFIIKSVDGHGGTEVFYANNVYKTQSAKNTFKGDYITQKTVSEKGKDLRVYVMGKNIIASILRTNENDFRSNFSLGGKGEVYKLSNEEKAEVMKITELFDFGFVGVDFMFDNGRMIFNEIEDVVGSRMLYKYTDINIVELYMDYIEEKMKG